MPLKIYNTLTRSKEIFEPVTPGKVSMYVCGPTVYNYIHIGNARPVIVFDVVRRYLTAVGYDVRYVVNFTDVDDKLIRKAQELGIPVQEVADRFIASYFQDVRALKVKDADVHPRVTENMPEIIGFIQDLVDKGFAYAKEGDVFFRTSKFPAYGKLSHQNPEELQYGIRIEVDVRKEDPRDFVLWKAAKPGEIYWHSPWGDGRPGWHIECSTMAEKYLGTTLDIHGGGQDLQFPHHECELAQSEAHNRASFAKYWMHNGYVNMNNEKMSKSTGNVMNVNEMLDAYKPEAIRFFILSAHYRSPLNFTDEVLRQAENSTERIENSLTNLKHRMRNVEPIASMQTRDEAFGQTLAGIRTAFHDKLQDDFNTPDALTCVFDLVAAVNLKLKEPVAAYADLQSAAGLFREMDDVLGILADEAPGILDEEVERLIRERTEARKAKNWARADEIRDQLTEQGIVLEDTPQGLRWRRK